jgi:hypothetical protein
MRNATVRFIDDRRIATNWQFYEDGKVKTVESAEFTRVR